MNILRMGSAALVLFLVACGDDGGSSSGGTGGEAGMGGMGGMGGMASTTVATGTGGDVGTGGAPGTGGSSGSGETMVNGCTLATAEDKTGTNPTLAWDFGHQSCIVVSVGASVTWDGSQSTHPLVGGESPTVDPSSVIGTAIANGNSAVVTFDAPGAYPYFCSSHTNMMGVVYVQ